MSAFNDSKRNCSVRPSPSVAFLITDRSTLLTLSVRTESKRSGNVRTFDPSCCADDLVEPGIGVEPAGDRPLVGGQRDVVEVAGEDDVAEVPIGNPLW